LRTRLYWLSGFVMARASSSLGVIGRGEQQL
jgi:hypothetical protein